MLAIKNPRKSFSFAAIAMAGFGLLSTVGCNQEVEKPASQPVSAVKPRPVTPFNQKPPIEARYSWPQIDNFEEKFLRYAEAAFPKDHPTVDVYFMTEDGYNYDTPNNSLTRSDPDTIIQNQPFPDFLRDVIDYFSKNVAIVYTRDDCVTGHQVPYDSHPLVGKWQTLYYFHCDTYKKVETGRSLARQAVLAFGMNDSSRDGEEVGAALVIKLLPGKVDSIVFLNGEIIPDDWKQAAKDVVNNPQPDPPASPLVVASAKTATQPK